MKVVKNLHEHFHLKAEKFYKGWLNLFFYILYRLLTLYHELLQKRHKHVHKTSPECRKLHVWCLELPPDTSTLNVICILDVSKWSPPCNLHVLFESMTAQKGWSVAPETSSSTSSFVITRIPRCFQIFFQASFNIFMFSFCDLCNWLMIS